MLLKTHRPFAVAFTAATLMIVHDKIPCYTQSQTMTDILQVGETLIASGIASMLPDVDQILPIPHRTITHTIWIPCIALFVAFKLFAMDVFIFPALLGAALGYFSHLLGDAFSKAGIAWFWPLQGYHYYPGGAFVVKGPRGPFLPLYHSGDGMFKFMPLVWRIVAIFTVIVMSWRLFIR